MTGRAAVLFALLLAACGGAGAAGPFDQSDPAPDPARLPEVRADPAVDVAIESPAEASGEELAHEEVEDAPVDVVPEATGPEDIGEAPDPAAEVTPPPIFCRSFDDCADNEVCVFSLGECQRRSTWTDSVTLAYGIHPKEGTAGDVLIVDGGRLVEGGFTGPGIPRIRIGNLEVPAGLITGDENRALVKVSPAMQGTVAVRAPSGQLLVVPGGKFSQSEPGVLGCDGATPFASGVPGATPREVGPYAAGYVDLPDEARTRVYYPAACGGVRRAPVPGTWPLVCILHGNGALHLDYEYLAELLATWGFVSFVPATEMNMAGEDFTKMLEGLMPVIQKMRGRPLADVHEVLSAIATTPEIAFVGHSRGSGRAEEAIGADEDVAAHTVGAIFLGPVDDGDRVPGHFMVFGGGKDKQSLPANVNGPYDNQPPPRWMVWLPGGNHGSFCDHKCYGYFPLGSLFADAQPTVERPRQLAIVQSFALPFLQRAFGLDEPFSDWLDDPPSDPAWKVTADPGP